MKGFIEVLTKKGNVIININAISYAKRDTNGGIEISLLLNSEGGISKFFYSEIDIEDFKKLLSESSY